jgi:hypothetical protein
MPEFIVATHISEGRAIVAVCDVGIAGKKFEENGIVLDLSAKFYKGAKKSAEETAEIMKKAYILNVAGKDSVGLAVKLGLAKASNAKIISKIPHLQILKLLEN